MTVGDHITDISASIVKWQLDAKCVMQCVCAD